MFRHCLGEQHTSVVDKCCFSHFTESYRRIIHAKRLMKSVSFRSEAVFVRVNPSLGRLRPS